jgi:hypothetical protein
MQSGTTIFLRPDMFIKLRYQIPNSDMSFDFLIHPQVHMISHRVSIIIYNIHILTSVILY